MKTLEDEAFEDIERRQGGFQAKRAMAADKVQDETDMLTIAYLDGYERGKKTVQRKWVGLTEDEREQHCDDWQSNIHDKEFQAIEAKLKEKNS